ncbi:GDP-mannose mannosyl hydrolase [Reinekea marinisedimentorum]|nr:GDP-mannose mannosyl hydrolase [Reinekea marinisedimentorum]
MYLSDEAFESVISSVPLVSVDLIVRNTQGEYLLGLRQNRPAQGYWFVPGGRIQKNEPIVQAFSRLTQQELGRTLTIDVAKPLGAFDHFYTDCVFGEQTSTHYVALGYELQVDFDIMHLPREQHGQYQWFSAGQLLASDAVHKHTKWYVR